MAGVAISTLTGQGNIIGNAENAVGKYNNSEVNEEHLLNEIEKMLEEKVNGTDTIPEDKVKIVVETNLTGGTVSGDVTIICNKGDSLKEALRDANIIISANEGYTLDKLVIENVEEFSNLEELKSAENILNNNITIKPVFEVDVIGTTNPEQGDGVADKYQVTIESTVTNVNGGSITPTGRIVLTKYDEDGNYSENGLTGGQTYTIQAYSGYHIEDVKINGVSIGATETYTFNAITESSSIAVTFTRNNT